MKRSSLLQSRHGCAGSAGSHYFEIDESQVLACARDLLVLCNRTQSGGDTYYCIDSLLCNRDFAIVTPLSTVADPLEILVDIVEGHPRPVLGRGSSSTSIANLMNQTQTQTATASAAAPAPSASSSAASTGIVMTPQRPPAQAQAQVKAKQSASASVSVSAQSHAPETPADEGVTTAADDSSAADDEARASAGDGGGGGGGGGGTEGGTRYSLPVIVSRDYESDEDEEEKKRNESESHHHDTRQLHHDDHPQPHVVSGQHAQAPQQQQQQQPPVAATRITRRHTFSSTYSGGTMCVRVVVRAVSRYRLCNLDPQDESSDIWTVAEGRFQQSFFIKSSCNGRPSVSDRIVSIKLRKPEASSSSSSHDGHHNARDAHA